MVNAERQSRDPIHDSLIGFAFARYWPRKSPVVVIGFCRQINRRFLPYSAVTSGDNFYQRWINRIRGREVDIEHEAAPTVRRINRASNECTDEVHTVFILCGR